MPTRSPFPGMDPYLERRWGNTHTKFVTYTADALNPRLPGDLTAEVEEYVHIDDDDGLRRARKPDVYVIEDPLGPDVRFGSAEAAGGAAVASVPVVLLDPGPYTERPIHIIDDDGNRIVTAIEFLSPWNKRPGRGRDEYLRKRAELLDSPAHLIEVDLCRAGSWFDMTDPYTVLPEYWTPYRVMVYRRTPGGGRAASLYPVRLSDRLPTIHVPLRPHDADVTLDVQAIVDEAYAKGAGRRLDYARDCTPPLTGGEATWADRLLRAAGRRA